MLHRVASQDLAQLAYAGIKDLVVRGHLSAVAITSAEDLSHQLAVSRTPVREALLRLRDEGFVEILPQRGVRAKRLTPEFVRELYEMRSIIEGHVAGEMATRLTKADLDLLEKSMSRQRGTVHSPDDEWLAATEDLHLLLVRRFDNRFVLKQFEQLLAHHTRARLLAASLSARRDRAVAEHEKIIGALVRRNGVRAQAAMREHLASVCTSLSAVLNKSSDGEGAP
jgi:DNA-binding GntR family transcriptional regulator